ncbi:MAG: MBL fold metallo-hydrolase [Lautropia sp.]
MHLPEVDWLRLTSVVDNYLDPLLGDEGPARRRRPVQARSFERCLCSEHGLAEIIESSRGDEQFALLFDFSATPAVYLHNLGLLVEDYDFDLSRIGTLVLSHGHWDHYGGLCGFLDARRGDLHPDAALFTGEDAFLNRWSISPEGARVDSGALDEAFVSGRRVRIVKVRAPEVLGGQVLISGEIGRRTDYEKDPPGGNVTQEDGRYFADTLPGEQALIYHLKGKGLVVLTACGHAGVVNTVLHAQTVTGVDKVHAVIGGFHLSGAAPERIARTVDGLAAVDPDLIIPMHCTGMATIEALRAKLPGRVVYNSAGTRYELQAA